MDLITVFLSSTGKDLQECRNAVRDAITSMDGYHCCGMEDFGSRDCSSKEFCVEQVRQCDCFVGLVGLLYGSSPEGEDKSYTEIEYNTADECVKPRLMCVAPNDFSVPGNLFESEEKRGKQQAFRFRVDNECQRGTFRSSFEAAACVTTALHNWERKWKGAEQQSDKARLASESTIPSASFELQEQGARIPPISGDASWQRQEAANLFAAALSKGDVDFAKSDSKSITDFQVARLFLGAKTLFARRCASECLTSHEVNSLYSYREQLKVGGWETEIFLQTMFGDSYDIAPGWYWFRDMSDSKAQSTLWHLTLQESDETIRMNAINLLRKARILPPSGTVGKTGVLSIMVKDRSAKVRKALMSYLADLGTSNNVPLIEQGLKDKDVGVAKVAEKAKWHVRIKTAPEEAFEELLQLDGASSEAITAIRKALNDLKPTSLSKATGHKNKYIRRLAVEELIQREALPKEVAYSKLNDESFTIRETCYKYLIKQGECFDPEKIREALTEPSEPGRSSRAFAVLAQGKKTDPNKVIYELFQSYDYAQLMEKADGPSIDGSIAYKVLAEDHFEQFSGRLRADLQDCFGSLKQKCMQEYRDAITKAIRSKISEDITNSQIEEKHHKVIEHMMEEYAKKYEGIEDFTKGVFISAALSGLVKNGESSDLLFARRFLAERKSQYHWAVETEAIRLIQRFGDETDVDGLVAVAQEAYGKIKELAAKTVLELSPSINGTAKRFLEGDDSTLFRLASDNLVAENSPEVKSLMESYLASDTVYKRSTAVLFLVRTCSPGELRQVLEQYIQRDSYFYNVVCWLDRVLYAPELLRSAFMRELKNK